MKKEKLITYFLLIGIILAIPSTVYLIEHTGNLAEYTGTYSYIIGQKESFFIKTGTVIYISSVLLMFWIYWKLMKHSDQFQNIKSIMLVTGLIGITFLTILPNTSRDIFFYMSNGRLLDQYGENPYETSIAEAKNLDTTDALIQVAKEQSQYRFVYGPVFLTICGLLNKISFSSVALYLYEFKLLNFIAYFITVYLIYVLTKKKKLTIVYAWNPLVLLETLVNVHNDIFVLLFLLLGIWFIKEAEKCRENPVKSEFVFIEGLLFLVLSACIKYVAILILPFVILYRVRKESIGKKILWGIGYLFVFFSVFFLAYAPYVKGPLGAFTGAINQSGKLKDSIYLIIAILSQENAGMVSTCYSMGFFVFLYVFIIKVLLQCFRKNTFKIMAEYSYTILMLLIFVVLTNLTSWYLIWLFFPVFWTNGKKLKSFIWLRNVI